MAQIITEDRGPQIVAISCSMIALAAVAVALRCSSRYVAQKAGLWWDDWLSLAALPFIWAICALSIYCVSTGLGKHVKQVLTPRSTFGLELFALDFIYNIGLTLVKMSVLMFYVRVFGTVRAYQITFWIMGAIIVGWGVATSFLALFTCTPIRKSWDRKIPGHCSNRQRDFMGAAISNILTDLLLLFLPMPMLWRIQVSTARKYWLVGVFAAGYLVLILSILRIVFVAELGNKLDEDPTWNGVNSEILVMCEMSVAIISSCIPSIFNLVKHAAVRPFSYLSRKLGGSNTSNGGIDLPIGTIRNPVKEPRKKGFIQLQERILTKQNTPFDRDCSRGTEGSNMEEPLPQVLVREDFGVVTQSYHKAEEGRNAFGRL